VGYRWLHGDSCAGTAGVSVPFPASRDCVGSGSQRGKRRGNKQLHAAWGYHSQGLHSGTGFNGLQLTLDHCRAHCICEDKTELGSWMDTRESGSVAAITDT